MKKKVNLNGKPMHVNIWVKWIHVEMPVIRPWFFFYLWLIIDTKSYINIIRTCNVPALYFQNSIGRSWAVHGKSILLILHLPAPKGKKLEWLYHSDFLLVAHIIQFSQKYLSKRNKSKTSVSYHMQTDFSCEWETKTNEWDLTDRNFYLALVTQILRPHSDINVTASIFSD